MAGRVGPAEARNNKQAKAKANKTGSRSAPTTKVENGKPFVLLISLQNESFFDDIYGHMLAALHAQHDVTQALSASHALECLAMPKLVAVLVTDAGITEKRNQKVVSALVDFARNGGHVVVGCLFNNFITGDGFHRFFENGWGLPWHRGSYHRTTHYLNPDAVGRMTINDSRKLPQSFSMKAIHVAGAVREQVVYGPTRDSHLESMVWAPAPINNLEESPAVYVPIGKGFLGFLGDVDGEVEATNVILAMLGLL